MYKILSWIIFTGLMLSVYTYSVNAPINITESTNHNSETSNTLVEFIKNDEVITNSHDIIEDTDSIHNYIESSENLISKSTEESSNTIEESPIPTIEIPTIDLNDIIDKDFFFNINEQNNGSSGFAYAFYRLDGTKFAGENMNKKFFSACTIKIPYCYYICTLIDENPELAEKQLTYTKDCYHDGSGKIRKSKYGTKYTIEYLINQCLSISDNVAYEMLHKEFGISDYNEFIIEPNLQHNGSRLWADLTVMDLAKVWTRVYHYFEEDTIGSNILKEACTNTDFAYGVRTLDVNYSHKSGDSFDDPGEYHDAGIIWNDEDSYIFVFLTNGEHNKRKIDSMAEWAFDEFTKSIVTE